MDTMPVAHLAAGDFAPGRGFFDPAPPRGIVDYELSRGGRILVPRTRVPNGIANLAKLTLLDAWFNGGADAGSAWSIALVDGDTYTQFQATDTALLHGGWAEFSAYTVSGNVFVRGDWGSGAAAGQAVTNTSPVVFDFVGITGTASIQGIFVTSEAAKNSSSGLLWSTASFAAPLTVQSGDQLRVTYTVQL